MKKEFKRPTDLPEIKTIEEILFEIKDTNLYDISLNSNQTDLISENLSRHFHLGRKLVQYSEMFIDSEYKSEEDPFITSYSKVIEHAYEVNRYIVALCITTRNGSDIKNSSDELHEVIERIKSYLGKDLYDVKYLNSQVFIAMVLNDIRKLSKNEFC
jgi:hypothetical protein